MKILVAVICCEFKKYSLNQCLDSIHKAGFEDILLNYEGEHYLNLGRTKFVQAWNWDGSGKHDRQFDQDQNARLTPICIARNMVMDFAQQGEYDWLLFVDSDVMIPTDTKEKLFTEPEFGKIRSGLVPGRGVHSEAKYLFYPSESVGNWTKVDYATCGFLAIHKDIFWRVRFRWGKSKESEVIASEDPIFGSDTRHYLNESWWVNTSLKAEHIGELNSNEVSQF